MADFRFELKSDELMREAGLVIGRDGEICDRTIPNEKIAARHLRITVQDRIVHFEDLNTRSGTYINNKKLIPFEPAPLAKSAIVRLGKTTIAFDFVSTTSKNNKLEALAFSDAPLRSKESSHKGLLIAVILTGIFFIGALVALGFGYEQYKAYKVEEVAWQKAINKNQIPAFTSYLATYPQGRYRINAIDAIEQIQREKKAAIKAADEATYHLAKDINTIKSYERYLKIYPQGEHKHEAAATIKDLKRKLAVEARLKEEKAAWRKASTTEKKADYEAYLAKHSDGPNADQAKAALSAINKSLEEKRKREEAKRKRQAEKKAKRLAVLAERKAFKAAKNRNTVAAYRSFLKKYPNGSYAANAKTWVGRLYGNGIGGVRKDVNEAIRWFEDAATGGSGEAMRILGMHYEGGLGISRNRTKAANWYRKAAKAGDKFAPRLLERLNRGSKGP
ncbi:MAG: hypothetical protein CMM28_06235 [Rhodospirillaceae bacterium]|nr:hypothetical protein [Rhodospirillaceae bacterium]